MSRLALFLLGSPRVELDGEPMHIGRSKAVALLAYLAVEARPHSRDALATLLWPDFDQRAARAELRRALSVLNRSLGKGWLAADRESVGLDADRALWLDADQLRQRLAACEAHGHPAAEACPDCRARLTESVEGLYRDDFMAGFTLPDAPAFDEWQRFLTQGLRDELGSALERLAACHSAEGEWEAAIVYVRRWLELDPTHELAHRRLMALYNQAGRRSAALRQYRACVRVLEEELGVPPAAETAALYERLLSGAETEREREAPALPSHNLPAQPTPFVGREAELAHVARRLDDPACRLLTLVGPGGIGKTRLALQVAQALIQTPDDRPRFPHGVFFVSLVGVESPDSLVPTIASALNFSFYRGDDLREQLLDYLRNKELLLILDNFEHLLSPPSVPPTGGEERGASPPLGVECVNDFETTPTRI